jgi:hypothetical protein
MSTNSFKIQENIKSVHPGPSVGTPAAKEDPFVEGYTHWKFGGIRPQGSIGATPSFSPTSPKSKMDQKTAGMGIKVVGTRKDAMRS